MLLFKAKSKTAFNYISKRSKIKISLTQGIKIIFFKSSKHFDIPYISSTLLIPQRKCENVRLKQCTQNILPNDHNTLRSLNLILFRKRKNQ